MFFGYKTQIHSKKFFINLGCSHAASFEMPVRQSYPYLLAKKLDLGYKDYAYSRTSLDYSEYALKSSDYTHSDFVLWQLTYPWRKHNWKATNRHDARLDNYEYESIGDTVRKYADLLHKYKDLNVYFLFINQPYLHGYMRNFCKINPKLYPTVFEFIDHGSDEHHGGPETQKMIADKLYEFIENDKKN